MYILQKKANTGSNKSMTGMSKPWIHAKTSASARQHNHKMVL